MGTVGAVALDAAGNLAAATSTGGMTAKRWGRVGDSPIIGAGTYAANDCCAVSATGHGEYFIRATVAHEIASLMRYAGKSVREAADESWSRQLERLGGGRRDRRRPRRHDRDAVQLARDAARLDRRAGTDDDRNSLDLVSLLPMKRESRTEGTVCSGSVRERPRGCFTRLSQTSCGSQAGPAFCTASANEGSLSGNCAARVVDSCGDTNPSHGVLRSATVDIWSFADRGPVFPR